MNWFTGWGGGSDTDVSEALTQPTQTNNMAEMFKMPWDDMGVYGKLGVVSQGLGAFSNLASLYAGFKALKLQEKQFKFQRDAWTKNYNNQLKDYENQLKDRWTARAAGRAARGGAVDYNSMGGWVTDRMPNGQAPVAAGG